MTIGQAIIVILSAAKDLPGSDAEILRFTTLRSE
jgi:hypothetical protein